MVVGACIATAGAEHGPSRLGHRWNREAIYLSALTKGRSVMKSFKLATVLAGVLGTALLVMPAKSAPISAVPLTQLTGIDDSQAVQVRFRGGGFRGYRGGYGHRGGFHRRYGGYRGYGYRRYGYRGYGVRRAYLPGAVYGSSYCDPAYQYCGGY